MQLADGDYLFRKGDPVDYLNYLDAGTVVFEEVGAEVTGGNLFGEVAFFTEERVRTASARCKGPCEVMRINEDDVVTLFAQAPAFNVFLMRLLVKRIIRQERVASPVQSARGAFAACMTVLCCVDERD